MSWAVLCQRWSPVAPQGIALQTVCMNPLCVYRDEGGWVSCVCVCVCVCVCLCVCCAHHCRPVLPLCLLTAAFSLATCTASDCDLHAADGRPPGEDGGADTVWCTTLFTACRHGACHHTELLLATLCFSRVPALHTNACFSLLVFGHPVSVCLPVCM